MPIEAHSAAIAIRTDSRRHAPKAVLSVTPTVTTSGYSPNGRAEVIIGMPPIKPGVR